jgi:hypothetical protein
MKTIEYIVVALRKDEETGEITKWPLRKGDHNSDFETFLSKKEAIKCAKEIQKNLPDSLVKVIDKNDYEELKN